MLIMDDFRTYEQRMTRRIRAGDEYRDMVNKLKKSKKGVFSEEIKNKFGTIYTPDFVVEKTCELAFKYIPAGTDLLSLTYCDPAAGDGNFLIYLYKRLMKVENGMKPIEKSEHILTKCLFGIEILKPMHLACKLRLLNEHLKLGGDLRIFDVLNISWGNTIMVPEDVGKWEIKEYEGGLLPEEIRNRKYSVVISNPPYTNLKNLNNRIYYSYPKQRDMAQVFIRWCFDHKEENGIISLNVIYTWLNKIQDGAKGTRGIVNNKINEILITDEIMRYSENSKAGGGEIPTMIITMSKENSLLICNNITIPNYNIMTPGLINVLLNPNMKYPFFDTAINKYFITDTSTQSINKKGTNTDLWHSFVFETFDQNGQYYLIFKRAVYEHTCAGSFKLIKTQNIKDLVNNKLESQIMHPSVDFNHGLWLIGFLNTNCFKQLIQKFTVAMPQHGGWCIKFASNKWPLLRVPDFDYYKINHPEQFVVFMKWVEDNMRLKDTFLAGINAEFQKLIGEK